MNFNDLLIRTEPSQSDIKSVETIISSTGFFRRDELDVAMELVNERLTKGSASGYEFLFAEYNNKTIAYSCYGLIPCTLHSYDLYWIASHNDFRNKGVGSYILKLTEEKIRKSGGHAVYIETSSKDQYLPTRLFYEKNNYILKARLGDFYDTGDDKCIYVKIL